jgi:hypothetical protein
MSDEVPELVPKVGEQSVVIQKREKSRLNFHQGGLRHEMDRRSLSVVGLEELHISRETEALGSPARHQVGFGRISLRDSERTRQKLGAHAGGIHLRAFASTAIRGAGDALAN